MKVLLIFLFCVGCTSVHNHKNQAASGNNISRFPASYDKKFVCIVTGETDKRKKSYIIERRTLTQKELIETKDGVYFDIFGVGGFITQIKKQEEDGVLKASMIIAYELEEQGIVKAEEYDEAPAHLEFEAEIEADLKQQRIKFKYFRIDCFKEPQETRGPR